MLTPGDGFLGVDDAQLEYRLIPAATPAKPAIVMLHEGLGSAGLWRDIPDQLASRTGCAVLAYSRQGYGRSSPCALPRPLDYMTVEALEVLPQVLDRLGAAQVILLGHSDGGSIASLYAGYGRRAGAGRD